MLCTAATVLFVLALISDTSAYTFPAMAAPLLRLVQQHYFYRGQSHQNHHNLALHSAPTQRLATDRFSSSGVVRLETFEVGSGYDTNINRRKKSRSVNSAEKSRQLERILKALRGAKVSISLTEVSL